MGRKGATRAEKTFYIFFWVTTPYLFNWTEQEERADWAHLGFYSLRYNHHIMSFFQVRWRALFARHRHYHYGIALVHTYIYLVAFVLRLFPSRLV